MIVVATKLQKKGRLDIFKSWKGSADFKNIQSAVHKRVNADIPVLPLKFSAVFDGIFEQEKSIQQIMSGSWLATYQYKEVANQFNEIYSLINTYNGK